jgi:hypothetical protein
MHKQKQARATITALLLMILSFRVDAQSGEPAFPEYQRYVHTDWLGNSTYVENPMFPVYFNESQVSIGKNWTVVCPLEADHSYHVYCYGAWVHTGPEPKTDYDIFVYDRRVRWRACTLKRLGFLNTWEPRLTTRFLFPPARATTFVIVNDARESNGAEQATFMIIENVECDKWYKHAVTGKVGDTPTFSTSWAYEFMTESPRIELWVRLPDTLDKYEARLYLMSNAESSIVNNVSLPWEMGLYGNLSTVGGYNLESKEYRGVAYASCEFNGQDMFLNYTQPFEDKNTYHLVLMGEVGEGTIEFLVKTTFGGVLSPLTFPQRVTPADETLIAYATNTTELENATLRYTVDNWKTFEAIGMAVSNMACNATIPMQEAGSMLEYTVQATDTIKNQLAAAGNFTVKYPSVITDFNATNMTVTLGDNITATGNLSAEAAGAPVKVTFMSANATETVTCTALGNGTFTASFKPDAVGAWTVQAVFAGTQTVYTSESEVVMVNVEEPSFLAQNGLFIGGGVGGALAAVGAVVYIKKYRE